MSFRSVTTNTLYQALGKAVQIATVLVTTGILTRSLGSAQFGQYKLLLTLMLLFASLSDWGTGFIGTREAAKYPKQQSQIFTSLLLLRFFLSLVAGIVLVFIGLNFFQFPLILLLLTTNLLLLTSIRTSCQIIFQARLKMQNLAIAEIVSSLSFLLLLLFTFSVSSISLITVLLLLVIATLLTDLISYLLLKNLKPSLQLQLKPRLTTLQPLVREALPMGALLVTFSIYNKLDILLLRHFQGDQAVGFYSLAYSIHDNLVMGAAFFMTSVFPILSRQSQGSPSRHPELVSGSDSRMSTTFSTSFHLLLLAGFLVSFIFFLAAPLVIIILGGSEFTPSIFALQILTLATFFAYLNHATGFTLVALGKQSISLKIALAALTFNLVSNYLLIPHFSFLASSVITIFTEILVFVLTAHYLISHTHLRLHLARLPQTLNNLLVSRQSLF
jgi:O-antigen/teichoic acid export membrane protein